MNTSSQTIALDEVRTAMRNGGHKDLADVIVSANVKSHTDDSRIVCTCELTDRDGLDCTWPVTVYLTRDADGTLRGDQ